MKASISHALIVIAISVMMTSISYAGWVPLGQDKLDATLTPNTNYTITSVVFSDDANYNQFSHWGGWSW